MLLWPWIDLGRDDLHVTCGHALGEPPVEQLDIVEEVIAGVQVRPRDQPLEFGTQNVATAVVHSHCSRTELDLFRRVSLFLLTLTEVKIIAAGNKPFVIKGKYFAPVLLAENSSTPFVSH